MIEVNRHDPAAKLYGYDKADVATLVISIAMASTQFCSPPLSMSEVYDKAVDAARALHLSSNLPGVCEGWVNLLSATHQTSLAGRIVIDSRSATNLTIAWLDEKGWW